MKIRELFPDVIVEDLNYEYKAILNPENPVVLYFNPVGW